MSELADARTVYRLTVGIESVEIIDGKPQPPEELSSIAIEGKEYTQFDEAKAAQVKLSGIEPEVIAE